MFSLRRSHRNGTHGLNKMRATAGTRAGRGARGQRLRPSETAAAHELLEDDAVPNVRVWEMYDEAARFENEILMPLCDLLTELESSTEGRPIMLLMPLVASCTCACYLYTCTWLAVLHVHVLCNHLQAFCSPCNQYCGLHCRECGML